MFGLSAILRRSGIFLLAGILLAFSHAYGQQAQQAAPPNPYMQGTAGPGQGPRGLTSYMPVAITEGFASPSQPVEPSLSRNPLRLLHALLRS